VGGYLNLESVTSIPDGFNPTVGGSLYLESVTSIPDGFNPTVGGYLNLESVTSIPDGFNPTVGGDLNLKSVTSIPDGFNPTVGGDLNLENKRKYIGLKVNIPKIQFTEIYTWQNGRYIKADGIFMEVLSEKRNIYRVRKINKIEESYLITDGHGKWSHGNTIKEAKNDLVYKISNRDKSEYKKLSLNSELSFEQSIECYRIITGACSFGTRNFCENILKEKKEKYSIMEIIDLTKGQWGNKIFEDFFI